MFVSSILWCRVDRMDRIGTEAISETSLLHKG